MVAFIGKSKEQPFLFLGGGLQNKQTHLNHDFSGWPKPAHGLVGAGIRRHAPTAQRVIPDVREVENDRVLRGRGQKERGQIEQIAVLPNIAV